MSNSFSRAVELVKRLPEPDQEALGLLLLEEMRSEKRWAKLLKDSQDQLAELADRALAEHRAGKTKPWP
jgi:hypothetical protein